MKSRVVVIREAKLELHRSVIWYENQRAGLGEVFHSEVQRVLHEIGDHPEKFAVALEDIREAPVAEFPFVVFYRVRSQRVRVLSIFHTSRDPGIWQSRS